MSDIFGEFEADDLDLALRQLCFLPVLGGGYNMTYQDALKFPIKKVSRWLEWANERRK